MRYEDFAATPSGVLVPTVFDEKAFVPHPLAPPLDHGRVAGPLSAASAALGELRGACRRLSNPYMLIRPLQRLEAQTSSAMEGTHTTSDELVLAEAGLAKDGSDEAKEVANYIRALAWAERELARLPLSARLIRGIHAILLEGVGPERGQDKRPGEFKRDQNMIGANLAHGGKARLKSARFVPAPPGDTIAAISDLERYLHRPDKQPGMALVDLALVHYQFETIHPFDDGNGRVGRILISLMAMTEGLLDMPVLYLSPELETRKDAYIDLMYAVSARGAWEDWIVFFFDAIANSAIRTIRTVDAILALHHDYQTRVRRVSRSANALAIVDHLFEQPVLQARDVTARLGITDAGARNLLRQLTEVGILTERSNLYPTLWVARGIIDAAQPAT